MTRSILSAKTSLLPLDSSDCGLSEQVGTLQRVLPLERLHETDPPRISSRWHSTFLWRDCSLDLDRHSFGGLLLCRCVRCISFKHLFRRRNERSPAQALVHELVRCTLECFVFVRR